jgi:hypothetical protein
MSPSPPAEDRPELVQRYLERAIRADVPGQVEIHQAGEMFRRPRSRPLRFTAKERFATDRVAFTWDARFSTGPVSALRVTDGYEGGHGALSVRVFGIPLQSQSGHEVAVGEAYRYLAELPWVPYAMAANPQLHWRQIDGSVVEVSTEVGAERVAVMLSFARSGDIVRSSAEARPRSTNRGSIKCHGAATFETTGGAARSGFRSTPRSTGTSPAADSSTGVRRSTGHARAASASAADG